MTFFLKTRKERKIPLCKYPALETSCPERLWCLHLRKYSKAAWTWCWRTCCRWLSLSRGLAEMISNHNNSVNYNIGQEGQKFLASFIDPTSYFSKIHRNLKCSYPVSWVTENIIHNSRGSSFLLISAFIFKSMPMHCYLEIPPSLFSHSLLTIRIN